MNKYIFAGVFFIAVGLEIADITITNTLKVGLVALVCTIIIFLLDRKIEDKQITSLLGYAAFALIALGHSQLLNLDFINFSDETYLTAILFAAGIPLTASLQNAIG